MRKNEAVAAVHDIREVVSPSEHAHGAFHAEFSRSSQYLHLQRPSPSEDRYSSGIDATEIGQEVHDEHRVLFRNQASAEENNQCILRQPQLAAKARAIGRNALKRRGIHSVIVHGIAFWTA